MVHEKFRNSQNFERYNHFFISFGTYRIEMAVFHVWAQILAKLYTKVQHIFLKYNHLCILKNGVMCSDKTCKYIIWANIHKNSFSLNFNHRPPTDSQILWWFLYSVGIIMYYYVSDRCCGHSFWDSDFSFGQNTPLEVY